MEDGKVVEDGTYEDLISRRDGKFRKMVQGQLAKIQVGEVEEEPEPVPEEEEQPQVEKGKGDAEVKVLEKKE